MQQVLGSIRQVRFTQSTPRQASIRENEGPSLGKTQLKMPHHRSRHAMKFEDTSQEETETAAAMRPKQGMEPCQKHIQAQRERPSYIPLARGRMGTPGCIGEFVLDFGASMHMVSKKDLNSAEVATTVMTAKEGANKRRSDGVCQRIGPIRDSYAS